jgi:transposase-like protein
MNRKPFHKQFIASLDEVERRAKAAGSSITALCREAGVARATPDRWRNKAPETIDVMDRLLTALNQAEEKAAANTANA